MSIDSGEFVANREVVVAPFSVTALCGFAPSLSEADGAALAGVVNGAMECLVAGGCVWVGEEERVEIPMAVKELVARLARFEAVQREVAARMGV